MNWDQIEIKWAEMTGRMRADAPMPGAVDGDRNGGALSRVGSPASDPRGPAGPAQTEAAASPAILANAE